jgi:hypothetical protein
LQGIGKKYFNKYHTVVYPVKWNFSPQKIFWATIQKEGWPMEDRVQPPQKEGTLEEFAFIGYSEIPEMKMGENPNFWIKNAVF